MLQRLSSNFFAHLYSVNLSPNSLVPRLLLFVRRGKHHRVHLYYIFSFSGDFPRVSVGQLYAAEHNWIISQMSTITWQICGLFSRLYLYVPFASPIMFYLWCFFCSQISVNIGKLLSPEQICSDLGGSSIQQERFSEAYMFDIIYDAGKDECGSRRLWGSYCCFYVIFFSLFVILNDKWKDKLK